MEYILTAVVGVIALIAGLFAGRSFGAGSVKAKVQAAEVEAKAVLEKAKLNAASLIKDKEIEAKEKALKIKTDAEREMSKTRKQIDERERKAKQQENTNNQKTNNLKTKEKEVDKLKDKLDGKLKNIDRQKTDLDIEKQELDKLKSRLKNKEAAADEELAMKLEKVAGLSADEAKRQLKEAMIKKAETEALAITKDILDEAKLKANKEAKKLVIQTIQRVAAEHTIENAVSVFNLESDDVKGQIIGREGRNIRAIESATGVEIIVDDTPEAVIISGYDPYRREVARLSLQRLVADGRIHPARIEEVVNKTRKQLDQQIVEIGERTVIELNIHGLHPQLIKLVGKMRFRSSYGQNLLMHSRETANMCAIMASELKMNTKLAKRAGLLHDIGKVSDEDPDLSHALLGMKLAEKYNEKASVCNAIGAHHDEIEMKYLISPVVQACDAISGSRPGARREILEQYMKRIKELEELAASYEGVDKAYAIQAGRELRVIVASDKVTDDKSEELSFAIATKIQTEMQYPGQIKVTVIREKRAVNYAK